MKNNKNKYPFANEVKEMKDNFKKMIDSMSGDEGWEDEAAKFYGYNPDDIEDDNSLSF